MEKGYTLVELIICVGMLGVMVLIGFGIYAIIHFLMKFW